MATTTAPISIDEYLKTPHEPGCEYVDGELIPKEMPTNVHAVLQACIIGLLFRYHQAGVCELAAEQSVRVRQEAVLIPDICALRRGHGESGIITQPALLCIEILSLTDRFAYTIKKCDEYLRWGVPACWIFDPEEKRAWFYDTEGLHPVLAGGILRLNQIELALTDLWPS